MRNWIRSAWLVLMVVGAAPLVGADGSANWVDARRFGPFVCRADFSLDGYEPLLSETEQLQADLVAAIGIQPATQAVELFLFRDRSSYRKFLASWLPDVPYRRALFVKGDGPGGVYVYRGSQFEEDLRHEATHALLHASLAYIPLWLDEGLAEYFEAPRHQRAWGHPHASTVRRQLRWGSLAAAAELERKTDLAQMGRDEYRDAWAWVHFMLHGPPAARDELVRYMVDLRDGTPPEPLSDRLHRRIPNLELRLREHFLSRG